MKYISIQHTRDNLAEIIEKASLTGENFVVTKFGKPKALITPIKEKNLKNNKKTALFKEVSELWSDRNDINNPVEFIKNQRKERLAKVSS